MRKGKMVAQGAHASLLAIFNESRCDTDEDGLNARLSISYTKDLEEWMTGTYTKICVSVNSEQELMNVYFEAKEKGLPCAYVQDLGLTEFRGIPTMTAVAIGPASDEIINEITGHLKTL